MRTHPMHDTLLAALLTIIVVLLAAYMWYASAHHSALSDFDDDMSGTAARDISSIAALPNANASSRPATE